MLMLEKERTQLLKDIAEYAMDGRLTEPSDGKSYEWRKMIELAERKGRPLTEEEAEQFLIAPNKRIE